jgi:hypothetical protein
MRWEARRFAGCGRRASDYSHYAVLKSYCPKAKARTSGCSFAALSQKIVMQKECIDVHIWVMK